MDEQRQHMAANGPIYAVLHIAVSSLNAISPVEWMKRWFRRIWRRNDQEDIRKVANIAIDIFIVLKWAFVILIWVTGVTHWLPLSVGCFLLVMNLHTYFWYHLWVIDRSAPIPGEEFRERRRFVNLVFAIAYSMVFYGYVYHRVLYSHFIWPQEIAPWVSSIVFSIGNALTGYSGDLKPNTSLAHLVVSSQLVMTFIFVALLLSNSVPRSRK